LLRGQRVSCVFLSFLQSFSTKTAKGSICHEALLSTRQCLICDEICPYNAINSHLADGHHVTVPVVDENRCSGYGYCESKCPVAGDSDIMVEPLGELRLASGSYQEEARELGLVFQAKTNLEEHSILDVQRGDKNASIRTPRGESKGKKTGLPPGFMFE
jgi:Pyruvate/2-oxoacid:ferredoxin oxidoreductase delta subunit